VDSNVLDCCIIVALGLDYAHQDARYGEIILETKNALAGDAE
jgi:hypothetical protein